MPVWSLFWKPKTTNLRCCVPEKISSAAKIHGDAQYYVNSKIIIIIIIIIIISDAP